MPLLLATLSFTLCFAAWGLISAFATVFRQLYHLDATSTAFLIATRITPNGDVDVRQEDASVVLLRVLDHADLPNAADALRVRVENAQRVSGEAERSWDHRDVMDPTTHHLLSYAGIRCRVLGTYYVADCVDADALRDFAIAYGGRATENTCADGSAMFGGSAL